MFLLFTGDTYYPGGWNDFRGVYLTKEAAVEAAVGDEDDDVDWWHVVELATLSEVAGGHK